MNRYLVSRMLDMKKRKYRIILTTIGMYMLFGFAWILLTDRLVFIFVKNPQTSLTLEIIKGWLFVILTSILLYVLLQTQLTRQEHDLIALEKARRELGIIQEQFRATFEQAAVGIAHMELDNHFIRVNTRFCSMLNYSADELLNTLYSDLIYPNDFPEGKKLMTSLLAGEATTYSREIRLYTKTRELIWVTVTVSLVKNESGQPWYWIIVVNDIKHLMQVESELRSLNEQLERRVEQRTDELRKKNNDLEEFSFSISHDLRSPLRAINGFAEILSTNQQISLDEESRHSLDMIITASLRMNRMIEDLLKYSRLGRQSVVLQSVDLNRVIDTVLDDLSAKIQEYNANVIRPASNEALQVWSDPTLLQQVLMNLVDNGLKYSRKDTPPEIRIETTRQNHSIIIQVIDNGIGIPAEYYEKIYKVFQRLHTDQEYPGTGIGLAIVKKAVEMIGGKISIDSKVNEGSTFIVELPAEAPTNQ
jgi:PAS domain S-box-containing protein